MLRGKITTMVVLAAAVCALVGALPRPAGADETAAPVGERKLRETQKAFLDPQAETGEHPGLTEPDYASHLRQQAQALESISSATVLPASSGGSWGYAAPLPEGFNAIHVVVGVRKVLLVAGSGNDASQFAAGTFHS